MTQREPRYRIANIIPPRPGAKKGTIVLDPADNPPVESVTVLASWLRATHARIGARVSFVDELWVRYHWEELDPMDRQHGLMDELYPRKEPVGVSSD